MKINLLPRKEIKTEISKLINDAIIIKGTVAFWTWDVDYINKNFGNNFFKVLNNPDSFFCVDVSTPITKIDFISDCSQQADNFFVFSYKFKKTKGTPLLHSKIIYIESEGSYDIFLGSHNNTEKAYDGINFEHSIHIKLSKKLKKNEKILLNKILTELENIKSLCIKFNQNNISDFQYNQPIQILLRFNNKQIDDVKKDSTITIVSIDLFDVKKDEYKNIYNKKVLLFLHDYQKNITRCYLAIGEADDKVEKGEMEKKVTTSDFIALKIVEISDHLALPYPFYGGNNKLIKGSSLKLFKHMIQRVRIIKEIEIKDILSIDDVERYQDAYNEIDFNDIQLLGINEVESNNILKIDREKYYSNYDNNIERLNPLKIEDLFISNTTPDLEIKIFDMFNEIFSCLFKSTDGEDFSDENNKQLIKILKLLDEEMPIKLNKEDYEISSEKYSEKIKKIALNIISDNIIDKKSKNKLGQFKTNFFLKK